MSAAPRTQPTRAQSTLRAVPSLPDKTMMRVTEYGPAKAPEPSVPNSDTVERSHCWALLAPCLHSTMATVAKGVKPVPVTAMVWPSTSAELGLAVKAGGRDTDEP